MIVSDVTTRVLRQFGDEASVQINGEDIIRWINDAVKKISVKNNLSQATGVISSVVDDNTYPFPADMIAVQTLYYDGLRMKFMKKQEYDEYVNSCDPKEEQRGTPWLWTRWGTNFRLYPKPDTAIVDGIRLEYIQRQPDITAPEDTIPLPLDYHTEVVNYCLQQAYQTDEDWDAASVMKDEWTEGVDGLRDLEVNKEIETYPVLTVLADDM